jgi:hypothetical protein
MAESQGYKEELQGLLRSKLKEQPNLITSPKEIAQLLMKEYAFKKEEYTSARGWFDPRLVHVPDLTGIHLSGRASAEEEYARGNPEELLVQRMGLNDEQAKQVMKILKRKRYEITSF